MRNSRLTLAAAALFAATMVSAEAATTPQFIIAGSSALFNTFSYVATGAGGNPAYTGPFTWTYKSGAAPLTVTIHDSRNANIVDEPGTVWVSWNADEAASPKGPNPQLSAYIQVDSAVGVRAALAVPAASLTFGSGIVAGLAGQNKIPNQADTPLPANVLADLNAAPTINLAAADIRAEDAIFATKRTLTAQGSPVGNTYRQNVQGLGYGGAFGPSIGFPIKSSQSGAIANPVDFAIFGSDPISGQPADPSIVELNVGAGPVIVFVNTTNTGAGHFGDASLTNINESALSGFSDGTFSRTRDAFTTLGLGAFGARTFIREPLSGTYNTFEYNIPNTGRFLTTQEKGVTCVVVGPGCSVVTQNPLNDTYGSGGGRSRAIGTGEEVSAVKVNADSLGYAFWSYGNFAGIASTTSRYLTVDGVDPLFANYSSTNGAFPQKSGSTFPPIPFTNVANGTYPIWTIFRIIVPQLSRVGTAQALIAQAQADAPLLSDFVPNGNLGVFRSHYFQWSVGPYNGHKAGFPSESGGDVGGAVYPIQDDLDSILDTGSEIYQKVQ